MHVPFVDLTEQYKRHREEFDAALASVITANAFIGGEPVKEFERRLCARMRRAPLHCLRQRDRRHLHPAEDARDWLRRRGHHHGSHLDFDFRDDHSGRRHAGIRRRGRLLPDRRGSASSGRSRRGREPSFRSTSTARLRRWTAIAEPLPRPRPQPDRGLRAGAFCRVARRPRGYVRRRRDLQLLSREEPRRVGRCRRDRHRTTTSWRANAACTRITARS